MADSQQHQDIMARNLSSVSQFSDLPGGRSMSVIGEDVEGE